MELPERTSYLPRGLELVLGHEVAHFVGGKIRNRKKRAEITVKILPEIVITGLCVEVFSILDRDHPDIFEKKAKMLLNNVEIEQTYQALADDLDKALNEQLQKLGNDYSGEKVESFTIDGMISLAGTSLKELTADMSEVFFVILIQEGVEELDARKKTSEFRTILEAYLEHMTKFQSSYAKGSNSIKLIVKILYYLFRECLSDVICIYTLNISFEKYVKTVIGELEQQDENIAGDNIYFLRMALVYHTIASDQDAKYLLDFTNKASDKELKRIMDTVINVENTYMHVDRESVISNAEDIFKKNMEDDRGYKEDYIDFFETTGVLQGISEYLSCCRDTLKKQMTGPASSILKRIRGAYDLLAGDEVTDIQMDLIKMQSLIDDYIRSIEGTDEDENTVCRED